jgi:hypothetical protein
VYQSMPAWRSETGTPAKRSVIVLIGGGYGSRVTAQRARRFGG